MAAHTDSPRVITMMVCLDCTGSMLFKEGQNLTRRMRFAYDLLMNLLSELEAYLQSAPATQEIIFQIHFVTLPDYRTGEVEIHKNLSLDNVRLMLQPFADFYATTNWSWMDKAASEADIGANHVIPTYLAILAQQEIKSDLTLFITDMVDEWKPATQHILQSFDVEPKWGECFCFTIERDVKTAFFDWIRSEMTLLRMDLTGILDSGIITPIDSTLRATFLALVSKEIPFKLEVTEHANSVDLLGKQTTADCAQLDSLDAKVQAATQFKEDIRQQFPKELRPLCEALRVAKGYVVELREANIELRDMISAAAHVDISAKHLLDQSQVLRQKAEELERNREPIMQHISKLSAAIADGTLMQEAEPRFRKKLLNRLNKASTTFIGKAVNFVKKRLEMCIDNCKKWLGLRDSNKKRATRMTEQISSLLTDYVTMITDLEQMITGIQNSSNENTV